MCKLKKTERTSHLHIDQRKLPSAAQIWAVANKEIKKPYIEKTWRPILEVAISFDRAGIAWLLVEGSKSSFISWRKIKITWLDKQYFRVLLAFQISYVLEKILSVLPRAPCSPRCLLLATNFSHFKCFLWRSIIAQMPVMWRVQTLVKRVAWFIWILSSHNFCVWKGNS